MRWIPRSLLIVCAMAGASAGDVEALVVPGDTIAGDLASGETDRLCFQLPAPADFSARVTAAKGLAAKLELEGPDGGVINLSRVLKASPGRTPYVTALRLKTAGRYCLKVAQSAGAGKYRATLTLRATRPATVDVSTARTPVPGIVLDAADIGVAGGVAGPDARPLDAVVSELHANGAATSASVATLQTDVAALQTGATSLAGRVTVLEAKPQFTGLRVASRAAALSFPSTVWAGGPPYTGHYVVRRAAVLSATFPANSVTGPVIATVRWKYVPKWRVGFVFPEFQSPGTWTVFAEVGGKQIPLSETSKAGLAGPEAAADAALADLLGIAGRLGDGNLIRTNQLWYEPTSAEKTSGFTVDLLLSATTPSSGDLLSFTIEVENASIVVN